VHCTFLIFDLFALFLFEICIAADTGMWIIHDDDIDFLQNSRDGVIDVHQPLAARSGLYFQPYCASLPIPPEVLSRCVMRIHFFLLFVCSLFHAFLHADSSCWE
jgi:hypothetical protein